MSIIGKNIKKIRLVKKLTQADFSTIFNVSRTSVGAYEEGRADPKIETLIQIANYFSISLDDLITTELTINKLSGLEKSLDEGSEDISAKNIGSMSFVSKNDQVLYISKRKDKKYINTLEKIKIPIRANLSLRAFEVSNINNNTTNANINDGDIVYGYNVIKKIPSDEHVLYMMVTHAALSLVQIIQLDDEELTVKNLYTGAIESFSTKEVVELWKLIGYISSNIFRSSNLTRLDSLEEKVNLILNTINKKP